jgi:hypothetical protein
MLRKFSPSSWRFFQTTSVFAENTRKILGPVFFEETDFNQ